MYGNGYSQLFQNICIQIKHKMIPVTKTLLITLISVTPFFGIAQGTSVKKEAPKNWHQLDRSETGYYGISLNKAYELVKNKKSKTVIVAVIDNGVDTLQEDLKSVLWHNPGEIPGNGIDDDHNGYIDDVYGWNFIGGKDGRGLHQDSEEGARVYYKLKSKYENITDAASLKPEDRAEYADFLRAKEKIVGSVDPKELFFMRRILPGMKRGDSIIQKELGKPEFNGNDLLKYTATNADAKIAQSIYLNICKMNNNNDITNTQVLEDLEVKIRKGDAAESAPKDFRGEIVKDNEADINDRFYGNNDVMSGSPFHGTHCSGIIAAVRNNGKGVDGIADNVKIMMIRVVPDGDEHDKDVANGIMYAVNNGAQIVNMSFGKDFSPQKRWVDDAVRYAESKGVLLIQAAGNDSKNIDTARNFPNPVFENNKGRAANYIIVGASSDPQIPQNTNDGNEMRDVVATFSNYGKKEVDVFAPGVQIYSTINGGNNYANASGTSMASPVVTGIAALILEYYPDLTDKQLKYVIEKSAVPITTKVRRPGTDELVNLSDISKSGGEVNAYQAMKLAATIKGERNSKPFIKPTPKLIKTKQG